MYDGTFTFWSHFIFGFIKGDQGGSKGIKTDQGRSKRIKTDQGGSRCIKEDQGRLKRIKADHHNTDPQPPPHPDNSDHP